MRWLENLIGVAARWLTTPQPKPEPEVTDGWLTFAKRMPMHPSWRYDRLGTPDSAPLAIVAHYTATNPGTAENMARNRMRPRTKNDRAASWHITIDTDGTVIQMAPLTVGCWHAGSSTAKRIPGVGWANNTSIGIELVGHGKEFPPAQVDAACRVWHAIVQAYDIKRKHAMVGHSDIDPKRRSDPGPVWMRDHAPRVLEEAYR